MDRSSLEGGFLSGSNGRLLDMERPVDKLQQGQVGHQLMTQQYMMSGIENEQPLGFLEGKELSLKAMSMDFGKGKGISLRHSPSNNTTSEDDEPSLAVDVNGESCNVSKNKKESPWQRMKWTDNAVKLLIAVVASVGDEGMFEAKDGLKRKSMMLQKKGKWKMLPSGGKSEFDGWYATLTEKAKDEVKKILSSKHLFYREMCAFHNGQRIPGCHDIDLQAHLTPTATPINGNTVSEAQEVDENENDVSYSDESYEGDEKNSNVKSGRIEGCYARSSINEGSSSFSFLPDKQDCSRGEVEPMFQDMAWIQQRKFQCEVQKLKLEAESLDLEKQRLKWLRFRSKKDREIERLRLENEKKKLQNDQMVLLLKQKEMVLGMQKSELSLESTPLSIDRLHGRDGINTDRQHM
ncbi:Myb/SANT-like DNA-binding domain-containing protein 4 [Bienertia sinuspersici]